MNNPTYIQLRDRTDKQLLDRAVELQSYLDLHGFIECTRWEQIELADIDFELDVREAALKEDIKERFERKGDD